MTDVEGDTVTRTLRRPTAAEAAGAIETALAAGGAVSVVGRCEVWTAREKDESTPVDRHLLLKPDGTLVVHGRTGAAPTNQFAVGEGLDVSVVEDRLRLRVGPAEYVEVVDVELVAGFDLDDVDASAEAAESDAHEMLRERLLAEPDLVEPGFRPRSTERETAAGPIDLYGGDAEGRAVVVEVKAHRAGPAAVGQLDRYVAALERDLHADATVRAVLVAPSATERTLALLAERGYAFSAVALER